MAAIGSLATAVDAYLKLPDPAEDPEVELENLREAVGEMQLSMVWVGEMADPEFLCPACHRGSLAKRGAYGYAPVDFEHADDCVLHAEQQRNAEQQG